MTENATMVDQDTLTAAQSDRLLAAAHASSKWDVVIRPARASDYFKHVQSVRQRLRALELELARLPEPAPDAGVAALLQLRASQRLLRGASRGIAAKPRKHEVLPVIHPGPREVPRLVTLCASYLDALGGKASGASFAMYLRALQEHDPLTLNEVWNLPGYLQFVLLESILDNAEQASRGDAAAIAALPVQTTGLRNLANTDWKTLLEPLIAFDAVLHQDPTGTYARMDSDSRELYRRRVAKMALHSDFTELQVAQHALDLAREATRRSYQDVRVSRRCTHIGYYLVSKGVSQLAARVGYHPPLSDRIRAAIRANSDDFYITGIQLITIVFIAAALFPLLPNYAVFGTLAITFLLMIMPTMQCAVELVNNAVSVIFDPEPLPKLDFSERIPAEFTTLVVVPTLLLNEKQVHEMVDEMEVRYLANRDANLHFALLTDLPDSVSKPHPNDTNPLVELAVKRINDLNAKYAPLGKGTFLFLHRHRIFNVRQGVWMGWERKRGKLLDLNKLLVGEYDAFPIKAGRLDLLRTVRYILTLDSDTQLPRGSAARLAGALAHPLNQAIIDPQRRVVTEGYGILQPRVGVSVSSATRSRLAALFSGQSGFDIYTRAISDAYQDLYGEGIFTGKGIYEVAALHAVLNRRFPHNSLLSHDLIEGSYARAGLVTDIEVIDDYPSHYSAYTRRKHRWVRGDWQIAQWIFGHVPDETRHKVPNPISTVSRWKIFDNLRRSLVEPFTFILFVAGWLVLPGGPLYWTIVPLLLFFFPTIVQVAFGLGRALMSEREGAVHQVLLGAGHAFLLACLNLFFLPHQAMLVFDAVFRSLVRRFITGEKLLEWETAAESESATRKITPVDRYLAIMPFLASVIAVIVYFFGDSPSAFLIAAPILFLWCMSTVLTAWLNRPPRVAEQLSKNDQSFLACQALKIWRYFHEFGTERHSFLIPDNVEEEGLHEAARVSPTNIGLLLNARQAACELGFITVPEYASMTTNSLASIGRLRKLRGHLYNWYETHNGTPLEKNPFVSSVDSGNFVASLYTLRAGTRELLKKPLLSPQLFAGLRVHWEVMQKEGKLPQTVAKLKLPDKSASVSEWLTWLHSAEQAFSQALSAPEPKVHPWWYAETERRVKGILALVRDYMPWLQPYFAPLRNVPNLAITEHAESLMLDHLIEFAQALQIKLAPATEVREPGESLSAMLLTYLPAAIRNLKNLDASLRAIAHRSEVLAEETEFGFLVNKGRQILSIGYDVNKGSIHDASYDMLASEARIASFLAIARGEMPQQGWFKLSRDYTAAYGTYALISWTGTMFEYLMPALWMRSYPGTLLAGAINAAVQVQQGFARRLGIPWGISESGSARKDDAGHYHYLAYGIPDIALFDEATAGPVISPYSTFLALGAHAEESIRNLRRMAAEGWVGAYGFYEAVDFTQGTRKGEVVREWMAHHQGMSLLAILNCLRGNIVQEWFHSNALIQSAELLLHETPMSKALLRASLREFDPIRRPAATKAVA
ncbi:MAG: glucoamylase family protein [Acidobacteriota bacterium]